MRYIACLLLSLCLLNASAATQEDRDRAEMDTLQRNTQAILAKWKEMVEKDKILYDQFDSIEGHRKQVAQQLFVLSRDLTAAQDRANQEVERLGPRRVVSSAMNPQGTILGGPTDATEALIANLNGQCQALSNQIQVDINGEQVVTQLRASVAQAIAGYKQQVDSGVARMAALKAKLAANDPGPQRSEPQRAAVSDDDVGIDRAIATALSTVSDWSKVQLIADDGTFLGSLNPSRVDSDSIFDPVGDHGSAVASDSVFNRVGRYGGEVGEFSPFSRVCLHPPKLYVGGKAICVVTVSEAMPGPKLDPQMLKALPKLFGR